MTSGEKEALEFEELRLNMSFKLGKTLI